MRFIIASILLITAFAGLAYSADNAPERMLRVTATGTGVSIDQAELIAFQSAVQQVVGTFVSAEQMLRDRRLKEEILTHSAGYIKEYEVIETNEENGIFKTKISALVLSTTLKKKVEKLNIATADIKGSHLFSEVITKARHQEDNEALLGQVWSKYPQAAYKIKMGEPKIVASNKDVTSMSLTVDLGWDTDFLKELRAVTQRIAASTDINVMITGYEQKLQDVFRIYFTNKEMLPKQEAFSGSDKTISLEKYEISIPEVSLNNNVKFNYLLDRNKFKPLHISLSFSNTDDQVVLVKKVEIRYDYFNDRSNVMPYEAYWPLMSKIGTHSILIVPNLRKAVELNFEVDTNLLKSITNIKAAFDSLN